MYLLRQALSLSLVMTYFGVPQVLANELSSVEKKAAACFVCHGKKGRNSPAQAPNLAGQQSVYLVNQLNAFKSGKRKNEVMHVQASNLTDEDINNYGAYFAVQEAAKAGGDPTLAKLGKDKAAVCLSCHGASGEGNGEFPRLAGQQPNYLAQQLNNFKNGTRQNASMQAIAGKLSEEEINALAAYFGTL